MKPKTFLKSLFALCLFAVVFAQTAMAQTIVKHIVQRGETLETIAERYSTTRDDIIRLNPNAAQFIYVGMELKITPQVIGQNEETQASQQSEQQEEAKSNIFQQKTSTSRSSRSRRDMSDYSHYTLTYAAAFESADQGYYAFGAQLFTSSGWGGFMEYGANYGIVDSDYAGMLFKVGPTFGLALSDNVLLSFPVAFAGYYMSQGKEMVYKEYTSHFTSTYGQTHTYGHEETKSKFYCGADFMPQVSFIFKRFIIRAGLDVMWADGSDVQVGFLAGIGLTVN